MDRIAIIGTGISGLGASYLLHPAHDITVYEKASVAGGHTRTRTVQYNGRTIAVDTGFIVFNYRNYPNLAALFKHLGVPVQKSIMSFAVTANDGSLEWGAENFASLFGQPANILKPAFLRFLIDVLRFNHCAVSAVRKNPGLTMGALLEQLTAGDWFARYYILPMGGAIWSCSLHSILEFPAKTFVDFFEAHGLLTVTQQPQWYTVTGGSQEYVRRLTAPFAKCIRTGCGAANVTRRHGKIVLRDTGGETQTYDRVIFACHADEALAILGDATGEERDILGAFTYSKNIAVLHRDSSIMPRRRRCWASWVYHAGNDSGERPIAVTYWMNHLQGIDERYPLFVTLNPSRKIPDELVFDRHEFEHPVYSQKVIAAQMRLPSIQGKQNTWFCGAYHNSGFHEDGFTSALAVARQMGASIPWH